MSRSEIADELPPTAGLSLRFSDLATLSHEDFSSKLAAFLGVPGLGVACSGTACLTVILETLRRQSSRTSVVIPAYTCPLVLFAIVKCGLSPELCDVEPDSFALDPTALAEVCNSSTLAIIPTHLGGRVIELGPVLAVARRVGAYVVEDAAQALGARDHGVSVGLRGDAGFFSLAAGKGLSLFEGGVWVAADEGLRKKIQQTSEQMLPVRYGWEARRCLELIGYAAFYRPFGLRYAYGKPLRRALQQNDFAGAAGDYFSLDIPLHRVSRWRQAVGARALSRLSEFQGELTAQAVKRLPQLLALPGLTVLLDPEGMAGTWPIFFVLLPSETVRDQVLSELWGAGLGVARMFAYSLPDYAYLRPWINAQPMPNARRFAACSLTITNSPWLDDIRFARIVSVLSRYCR